MSSEVVPLLKKGNEIISSISRVKLRNILGHKNPAAGTFGYFFQLWPRHGQRTPAYPHLNVMILCVFCALYG